MIFDISTGSSTMDLVDLRKDFCRSGEILTAQETPKVQGKDKSVNLRFGNVSFNDQFLKLPDHEQTTTKVTP